MECEIISHQNSPVQMVPFPVNPALQVQLNEPTMLLQTAFVPQLSAPESHSLTSAEQVVTSNQRCN